jgi:hypothetical protein
MRRREVRKDQPDVRENLSSRSGLVKSVTMAKLSALNITKVHQGSPRFTQVAKAFRKMVSIVLVSLLFKEVRLIQNRKVLWETMPPHVYFSDT